MSKPLLFFSLGLVLAVLPHLNGPIYGQQTSATIKITTGPSPSVSIALDFPNRRQLSFLRSVAGTTDLPHRISNLRLVESAGGASVSNRELGPGEFLAQKDFNRATYEINLVPSKQRNAAAHVSWIKDELGILMLADLLPLLPKIPMNISFASDSPAISSIYVKPGERAANLADPENAIFYVGSGWRMRATWRCKGCPMLFISGSWHFTDDEAADFVGDIGERYSNQFRSPDLPLVQIAIARFPVPTEPGAWEAETRGQSVTIISSDMPFKTQSLQRLHEQLRHEMFHLWIPGKLRLTGNYDWFYEGFALYQSLKLAVSLNRIRFDDFLDTLSRAHTIDSAYTQRVSLMDASKNRFSGNNTQVYARGMLVAFLTDLALMERSRSSVEEFLRTFYFGAGRSSGDGNDAVLEMMRSNRALDPIVKSYITGAATIDWNSELAAAGIEDSDPGPITTLRVREKLNGRQKTLLDKLGYNSWRKLTPNSK
jgi:hypothetical protein